MNRLVWCEIAQDLPLPDFGGVLQAHVQGKTHPRVRAASLSAWNLLALLLVEQGCKALPRVAFEPGGKPFFADSPLHFSLSHSENLAAVILSDAPCAVDVEMVQADVAERLRLRCMSPREIAQAQGFFEVWTKKECIAKLDGRGMPAHPNAIDTLGAEYVGRFFGQELRDSLGNRYALSALCAGAPCLQAEKRSIIPG